MIPSFSPLDYISPALLQYGVIARRVSLVSTIRYILPHFHSSVSTELRAQSALDIDRDPESPSPPRAGPDTICATLVQAHDGPRFRARPATDPGLDTMPVRLHPEDPDDR